MIGTLDQEEFNGTTGHFLGITVLLLWNCRGSLVHKTVVFCINIRVFQHVICIKMQNYLLDEGF